MRNKARIVMSACFVLGVCSENTWAGDDVQACCLPDANCYDVSPSYCLESGGTPQGPDSTCQVLVCECQLPQEECPFRACCLPDGSCLDLPKDQCIARGGAQGGPNTSCENFICGCPDQQEGCHAACCKPDEPCKDMSPQMCLDFGGEPGGEGTTCDEFDCDEVSECRVTGGGHDESGNWNGDMENGSCPNGGGTDRYTFGGQAGAPTAAQPQPFGEWTHHQKNGPHGKFVFHAGTASAPPGTEIDLVVCSDPGFCNPARPAPNKQIDFEGVGTFKNIGNNSPLNNVAIPGETFHWFDVHIEDLGEPGNANSGGGQGQDPPAGTCPPGGSAGAVADCTCPDFYSLTIHLTEDPLSPVIYHVFGYINGGNLQIHPAIN